MLHRAWEEPEIAWEKADASVARESPSQRRPGNPSRRRKAGTNGIWKANFYKYILEYEKNDAHFTKN